MAFSAAVRPFKLQSMAETKERHILGSSSGLLGVPGVVLCIALAKLIFHLATATRYGIFRDELYYLACARHLAWGYVDQPPLIAIVASIARVLFGDSLVGLRFFPALAGAGTVLLAAKLAQEFGGERFAQALAALAVFAVPIFLILHHWLTMNAFEPLIWLGCILCAVRAITRAQPRYWIGFGVVVGLGMENKYTTAFFVLALVVGLGLTRQRRVFSTPHFWLGTVVASLIFLPNFVWLMKHDFPFLELMHNIRRTNRDIVRGPVAFMIDQAQIVNPLVFLLAVIGVVWLLWAAVARRFRFIGLTYLLMLVLFIALKGKNYYITPIYPALFAAGAVGFEAITATRAKWTRLMYCALVIFSTALLAPIFAPILPPPEAVRYAHRLGIEPPKAENQPTGPLPQYFADEFGWEEMARETARVYNSLPPEARARAAIFANNYGEAGAIDFFGPGLGLPEAVCNHQSYWLWGAHGYDGSTVIVLGSQGEGDRAHFRIVEVAGRVEHAYSRRDEHFDIFLCRGLRGDLRELWPELKKYD
jgi:hypothetical protein